MSEKTFSKQYVLGEIDVPYTKGMHPATVKFELPERKVTRLKLVQRKGAKPRKSPDGIATNNLVLSAAVGNNADLFPSVIGLYVSKGSVVADVTYGKGVFWQNVPANAYTVHATDLKTGVDARKLPYKDASLDCVVFDPPYMHTPGGTAHVGHQNFEGYYKNNGNNTTGLKYHEAVLDLYFKSAAEAFRVLKRDGIYIVKCQDEVCACKQRLTHVEIINQLTDRFIAEDIFVLVRHGKPGVSRILRQRHARKNHSYFLVFRKRGSGRGGR
ncbi:MAG TPA: hypothetical protein VKV74_03780 [Bryobacteraceae bacterium]|nr:hypothetical protein [Bryobacteraceae bacterium]